MTDHGTHLARSSSWRARRSTTGDAPFGSVLVDSTGNVVAESRNRESSRADPTAHPELDLARWAWRNLDAPERASATVYTSGEHCPMCAAAHGWVGLGPIVFAARPPSSPTGVPRGACRTLRSRPCRSPPSYPARLSRDR